MRLRQWTKRLGTVGAASLALGAITPLTSEAGALTDTNTPAVSISIRAPKESLNSRQIPVRDLVKYGVPQAAVDQVARGQQPLPPAAATRQARPPSPVVDEWAEVDGFNAVMRRGYYNAAKDSGFGLTKIEQKHNLNLRLARDVTQYPGRTLGGVGPHKKYDEGGQTYRYEQDYLFVRCTAFVCTLFPEDRRTVRVIHNFSPTQDKKARGVVTAYCLNPNREDQCPEWVKNSYLPPTPF